MTDASLGEGCLNNTQGGEREFGGDSADQGLNRVLREDGCHILFVTKSGLQPLQPQEADGMR